MKKSKEYCVFEKKSSKSIKFKMKLCFLMASFMLFQLSANSVMSQTKMEFDYQNVPLKRILKEIKSQTGYQFFYNVREIDDKQKISLIAKKETANEVLKKLSEQVNFDFKINENQIVLTKRRTTSSVNQDTEVKGSVKDNDGQPLPGASIVVKGTTNGTTTDFDGNFAIVVPDGSTILVISYIGFKTLEVDVSGKNSIEVQLEAAAAQLDDVVIIGSRGKPRTDVDRPVPVDVVNAQELAATGQTDLGQQIQFTSPSFNSAKYGVNGTTNYADPAQLRGLGPDQALVLIDGKRRHQFSTLNLNVAPGLGNVVTDLNSLPSGAVKRIEVLRDGAAAQYGSDAIAGIINIALNDRNDGGTFQTTVGQHFSSPSDDASDGRFFSDGFTIKNSLNYGFKLFGKEKSFFNFTLEHFKFAGTNRSDYFGRSIYPATPDDYDVTGPTDAFPYDTANPREDRGVYPQGDFVVGNYGSNENETKQLFINTAYPIGSKGVKVYANGGYSDKFVTAYGFFRNPGNTRRSVLSVFPDGYVPISPGTSTDYSYTFGFNNLMTEGWKWDLSYTKGHNDLYLDIFDTTNPSYGSATPTFFHVGNYNYEHDIINADIVKDLGEVGGMAGLNLAFGAQYRTEKYWQTRGSVESYTQGQINDGSKDIGSSARPGIPVESEADRNSIGLYADVEADFTDRFLVTAAARFENYSDFGSNLSGKLATRYKLTDNFSIRGSYNRGFRAPSVAQLGTANNTSTVQNGNIIITRQVPNTDERLSQLGVNQPQAEISNNFNAGLTAKLAQGALLITLDAYQIGIKDRIVITERLNVANFPAVESAFGTDTREIRFFTNHINTKTKGLDAVVSYKKTFNEKSRLNVSIASTWNKTEVTDQKDTPSELLEGSTGQEEFKLLGQTAIELIEVAVPRQKFLLSANYQTGKIGFTGRLTRYGNVKAWSRGLSEEDSNTECVDGRCVQVFAPKVVSDLAVNFDFSKTFTLTIGANNIFDVYPDKYNTTRNGFVGEASSYAGGQIPYSRNSNQFGFNGRYCYMTGIIKF